MSTPEPLPPLYIPAEHEARIRGRWDAARAFAADPSRVLRGEAEPYCVLIPPPNVTAALHLGHALNNTLQDILVRTHRMKGFETLWMAGTDHAGIATQAVVEKRVLKEEGLRRQQFSREDFVARIQAFKDEYEATITNQLKLMGCSCDWDRQRFTMDTQCASAVYEAFFRLFKDGLIYRGKRLVNWDPVLQTAVADDECYDEEIDGNFYYLRYPLVHVPEGSDAVPVSWGELRRRGWALPEDAAHENDTPAWITVATTRPETYLGDTAVAINPHDPRAKALRGLHVELPLIGRVIPIIEDSYVVLPERFARSDEEKADPKAKMATGFLKVTPAHDPNDEQIGKRHNLPAINIFAPDATISDRHGWSDASELQGAHNFLGKKREEARKLVVMEFKARGWHEGTKPYRHSVKHSDRSKAIIEPYLSDQWYVKVTDPRLAQAANAALADHISNGIRVGQAGTPPMQEVQASAQVRRAGTPAPPGAGLGQASQMVGQASQMVGQASPPASNQPQSLTPLPKRAFKADSAIPHTWDQGISANLTISIRRLPHFERGGSTYFVTFRTNKGTLTEQERQIVLDACSHWHGKRARFFAVVVMPDHVHMLVKPIEREEGVWYTLGEIMHSIKSFTAHEINKVRSTKGSVWQDEWFDRIVRDAEEFDEKIGYIENNAVKAGLVAKPGEYKFLRVVLSEAAGVAGGDARPTGSGPAAGEDARPTDTPPKVGRASPPAEPSEALEATPVADNTISFHPERYAKTFKQWHDGIRDWCISRQLWWGHQVPVWTKTTGFDGFPETTLGDIFQLAKTNTASSFPADPKIKLKEGQSCVRYVVDHGKQVVHSTCALNNPKDATIRGFERHGWTRDPDVLDTWFSSALWPLSTMGWPVDTELLRAFNPSSTLCTAREIITLWVSRMVMFSRYLMPEGWGGRGGATRSVGVPDSQEVPDAVRSGRGNGPVPFRDVVIHAVIQDGEGRKMSKSLGNGIDPLDIIATHGSDAMRFILAQMATQTQDVRLPVEKDPTGRNTSSKFDLGKRLCNKLWNASRLALSKLPRDGQDANPPHPVHARDLSLVDRWMLARVVATTQAVDAALAHYEFAQYATAVYDLLWRDFCDWYLEAIKPTIDNNPQQQAVLAHSLEVILRLAHPAMPYVTEAIWEQARQVRVAPIVGLHLPPARRDDLLCLAGWPEVDLHLRDAQAEGAFERLRQVVEAVREVRAAQQVHPKRKITLHTSPALVAEFHTAGALVPTLAGLGAVIGITDLISFVAPHGSLKMRLLGEDAWLSDLADAVDAKAAGAMTAKRIAELEKQHDTITARLNNPGYAQRAPAKLVEESKAQLQAIKAELAVLRG